MNEIYGGHIVAKYLKDVEEVDTVFSLSGGHIDRIYDGFLENDIRLIDVRHEQAAAMMAHAWSIYKNQPGVCLFTAGPGFTNALTGLVNAHLENAPIIVLCGTSPVRDIDKGALQEMKQADMIKSSVKWHGVCRDITRIPEYLSTAFRNAVSGRPGPVFLELPPDVLDIKVDVSQVVWTPKGNVVYKSQPDPSLLKKAADLINKAEKPLLIGGNGIAASNCDDELKKFIDTTGVPFFLINTGRGAIPDDHPLSLWDGGLMSILTAAGQTDVIIAIGVRFNWLLMFGQIFPQAKVIRVDIDPAEIDRNRVSDVGLVGDADLTLKGLNALVKKREHNKWLDGLREIYLPMIQEEIAPRNEPSAPIHPARLVALVREAAGDEAIYVVDGGDTSYFGATVLNSTERSSVYASAGGQFGCLGTGIPFAIAAKIAKPDKNVIVINGDGSFGFNAMEFDTAVRHDVPFICVINNDQAWGMIKHGQEMCYGDQRLIGSELGVVHYEKIAEALGGYGEFVELDEDVIPAIKRAIASGKPSCINILTDPCVVSPMTVQFVDGLRMES